MSFWIKAPKSGTCCACKPIVCTPCTCLAPTLVCDSISASLTKCGFSEFGTASSPPKKYLVKTQSGGLNDSAWNVGYHYTNVWSGTLTYDRTACTTTDTRQLYATVSVGCSANITVTGSSGQIDNGAPTNGLYVHDCACSGASAAQLYGCTGPTVISTTQTDYAQTGCGTSTGGTTVSLVLSSESTTALLISDTVAALPAYPGTYAGTCSSYRNLSTNELTYTVRRFKYKFTLPSMTGITTYAINWNEGGTPKSYTWDGVATVTPVYGEVAEPSSNGTVAITDIVVTCT